MKKRILFLEDSEEMQAAVAEALKIECDFTFAKTNREACDELKRGAFDLVLLDLTLPDGDGFKICNLIRQTDSLKEVPVIFITGRAEIEDKELAFSIGADDYIVKPIGTRELRARVLSKLHKARVAGEIFIREDLKFDIPRQRVSVFPFAEDVVLETTSREFKILLFLAKHEDHVFSRDQLLNQIWGENVHLLERTVDTHISHLRKKLKKAGSQLEIRPVHGFGYKLVFKKEVKNIRKIS